VALKSACGTGGKYIAWLEECPTTKRLHMQWYLRSVTAHTHDWFAAKLGSHRRYGGGENANLRYVCKLTTKLAPCILAALALSQDMIMRTNYPEGKWKSFVPEDKNVDIALRNLRPRDPLNERYIKSYLPWQQCLLLLMFEMYRAKNDRKLIVIVDPEGGKGKTSMAMKTLQDRIDFLYLTSGKSSNMASIIRDHCKPEPDAKGNPQPALPLTGCFIDITRDDGMSGRDIVYYKLVEQFLNGMVMSEKYRSTMVQFNNFPQVVIFTNYEPDLRRLSADRWIRMEIVRGQLCVRQNNPLEEVFTNISKPYATLSKGTLATKGWPAGDFDATDMWADLSRFGYKCLPKVGEKHPRAEDDGEETEAE